MGVVAFGGGIWWWLARHTPSFPYYPLALFREVWPIWFFPVRAWLCGFFPISSEAGSPALRRWE